MKSIGPIFLLILILTACTSTPTYIAKQKTHPLTTKSPTVRIMHIRQQDVAQELLIYSMSLIDKPYSYGGTSRASGFDCSGMVQYIYRQVLNVNLPRTADSMARAGMNIAPNSLKIGDLVFFNTTGKRYSHVGLYIGNGRFIHAPNSRSVVKINQLSDAYYQRHFSGAKTYFVH